MFVKKNFTALLLLCCFTICAYGQNDIVSTRELNRINWMEFKETVMAKISAVILPTGTIEPHGVINTGAVANLVKDTMRRWDAAGL